MHQEVVQALRQVIDPELRVNVVDLGLIYSAEMEDGHVDVAMTLTTPGCPLIGPIKNMAESAIWQQVPGVESVDVKIIWSPPWRPTMMSEAAKDELGWL